MTVIVPVVLCGGSGTRLWPLSRKAFPKQFVPLIGERSLFELTLERVRAFGPRQITVAAEDHRFMVIDGLVATAASGDVILEPIARNTAAAMALAALHAVQRDDELLLFCPADHHIPDTASFAEAVHRGVIAARNQAIVTFGISPSFPSTGYGYIEHVPGSGADCHPVLRFIEKPDLARAQQLLLSGNVLWNAGIFLCRPDVLLSALERHAPDILRSARDAMVTSTSETAPSGHVFVRPNAKALGGCRSQSIDYAVMEHHENVRVVPFFGAWSDVGSWNAVADLSSPDAYGNRVHGQGHAIATRNTFIHAPHRPVVTLGVLDLLVIDTPDAVLIAQNEQAEQVKAVVQRLEEANCTQAVTHRKVSRPWGWYDSLDLGDRFQVKRIGVKPGASLSLQKHHHRAEHWVVVKGTAEVTRGAEVFLLSENQSAYIPIGEVHRLRNPGKVELEIIEVQSGAYLAEDDIVRIEDNYGRQT